MSDTCVLGGRRAALRLREQDDDTDWAGVAINPDDVPDELIGKVGSRRRRTDGGREHEWALDEGRDLLRWHGACGSASTKSRSRSR